MSIIPPTDEGLSYAAAGVDIDAYNRMLAKVRPAIEATFGPEVQAGVGPFSGLYKVAGGTLLAASTDSVGTKVKVAIAAGRHDGIGRDLVNHCVNDIATARARPLFFLDYFAGARLDEAVFTAVVEGLTAACREAGCALLGGETAEMPGLYALGDYDLAGFIVGTVAEGDVPDLSRVRAGDLLVGLPSSGLHTNGYSLVRKIFEDVRLDHVYPELGRPLGEVLLEPHRSYLSDLGRVEWKAAAHITGGGLLENPPRVLPEGLAARFDRSRWDVPPIFELIRERGRVADDEMLGTFNMGLGMVLVVDRDRAAGLPVVGEVVEQTGAQRVLFT
ncbi:MAG TPA: phosphoribosylformylglycinamidine cyclo-ligase [Candidatus Dormibacteraeota bacterium]